jgi:hypothetical protein
MIFADEKKDNIAQIRETLMKLRENFPLKVPSDENHIDSQELSQNILFILSTKKV